MRGDRLAKAGPNAVIVDACGHDENQNVMTVQLPCRHHLHLHSGFGGAVPFFPDCPSVHEFRNVSQGRDLAHLVEILLRQHQLRCDLIDVTLRQ